MFPVDKKRLEILLWKCFRIPSRFLSTGTHYIGENVYQYMMISLNVDGLLAQCPSGGSAVAHSRRRGFDPSGRHLTILVNIAGLDVCLTKFLLN